MIENVKSIIQNFTLEDKQYQKILKCVEESNRQKITENKIDTSSLYPHLDDTKFTLKISKKRNLMI